MNIRISMQKPEGEKPVSQDGPHRPLLAKVLGRIIIFCFVLGALTFLWYMLIDWYAARAWSRYTTESMARGWRYDWDYYVPPPVPDEQNFAQTPSLVPLFAFELDSQDWRDKGAAQRLLGLEESFKALAASKRITMAKLRSPRPEIAQRMDLTGLIGSNAPSGTATNEVPATAAATTAEDAAKSLSALIDGCCGFLLAELREASKKPMARFNLKYNNRPLASILLHHLSLIQFLSQQLSLRAYASLELNKPGEAFDDALLVLYLSESLKGEPFLVSHQTRLACRTLASQTIYEGLAAHRWSAVQLQMLQSGLIKDNFPEDAFQCLLGERAYCFRVIGELSDRTMNDNLLESRDKIKGTDFWLSVMPSGWFYYEGINAGRLYDSLLSPMEEWLKGKRDIQSTLAQASVAPDHAKKPGSEKADGILRALYRHEILPRLLGPTGNKFFVKSLAAQVRTEQMIGACALERYRLAKGEYPEKMESLVPQYLEKPPQDPFSGGPLKYRREAPLSYALYSVGLNYRDDGGKIELDANGSIQSAKGDLVWKIEGK
jgi:hypothetical protein